ncbi:MAG: hypothetical protein ACYS9T_06575 [Planctomycetota bacterium]
MKSVVALVLISLAGLLVLGQTFAAQEETRPKRSVYSAYGAVRPRKGRLDANSVDNDLEFLSDTNSIKAKLKEFEGLEKALEKVSKASQRETREWMRGPIEERRILARAVQDQTVKELAFIRQIAAEEGSLKTIAAIDGLLLERQERFGRIFKRMETGMRRMRRGERGYRRDINRGIGIRERGAWREGEQDPYIEDDMYRGNDGFRGRDAYRYRDRDRYRYRNREDRITRRRPYERDETEQDNSTDY